MITSEVDDAPPTAQGGPAEPTNEPEAASHRLPGRTTDCPALSRIDPTDAERLLSARRQAIIGGFASFHGF